MVTKPQNPGQLSQQCGSILTKKTQTAAEIVSWKSMALLITVIGINVFIYHSLLSNFFENLPLHFKIVMCGLIPVSYIIIWMDFDLKLRRRKAFKKLTGVNIGHQHAQYSADESIASVFCLYSTYLEQNTTENKKQKNGMPYRLFKEIKTRMAIVEYSGYNVEDDLQNYKKYWE